MPQHERYPNLQVPSPDDFAGFLRDRLTANQYAMLPDALGLNGTWFRRKLDNHAQLNANQVRIIAHQIGMAPHDLVIEWGAGLDELTAGDLLQMITEADTALHGALNMITEADTALRGALRTATGGSVLTTSEQP